MRSAPTSRGSRRPALAGGGLLLALLAALPAPAAELEVTAGFEEPVVGVEETVSFWIEVRSGFLRSPRIEPEFELENLEALGRPNRSESFRFVNGATARSLRLTWILRPLEAGTATVRSIRIRIGGQVLDLPSQRLQVVDRPTVHRRRPVGPQPRDPFRRSAPPVAERPSRPPRTPGVFLQAEIVPERPFVGQQAVYTLYLYTQVDISAIHPRQVPTFQGFWAHEVPLPRQQSPDMVEIHGRRYGRVPVLQRVLFARRAGVAEVESAEYDLVAQIHARRRIGSSFALPERIARRSNPLRVEVRDLPPSPPSFSGAVGRFELTAALEPPELEVGQATTLTVTLAGDGHVQSLPAPEPPEIPGVTVYPPEEISHEELDPARLVGRRSWSFVLVPRQVGSWTVEPFQVPFYDPAVDAYRLAASPAMTLRALPPRGAPGSSDPPMELNPIRSAAVPVSGGAGWQRLLPWLFLLPCAAAVALILVRRLDLAAGGHRQATAERLLQRLAEVRDDEVGNRQLASTVEQAWSTYLTERWDLPPDIPAARWADVVAGQPAAGPRAAEALGKLAEEIYYLRYAPQLSTAETLRQELFEHSRRLARRLP